MAKSIMFRWQGWSLPVCPTLQLGSQRERKLMGENLKVIQAEFSTLSLAVFVMSVNAWYAKHDHIQFRIWPAFQSLSLSL